MTDTTPRIDELEAALAAAARASHAQDAKDAHRDRLDDQIARLEAVSVRIERRMLSLIPDGDDEDAMAQIFAEERDEMQDRIDHIDAKITLLRDQRARLDASAPHRPPKGAEAELRAALYARAAELRGAGREDAAARVRSRLATLVRGRRDRLVAIERRVRDAASYLVGASDKLDALRATVAEDTGPATSTGYGSERGEVAAMVDMARDALLEGRQALVELAWRWPELEPMATRADWSRLPFRDVRATLLPLEEAGAAPLADRIAHARRTCRGLALWCRELAEAVAAAPPPV